MKKYSVAEVDELRRMCENRWLFGTYILKSGETYRSGSYRSEEKITAVEEMVRTLMVAGVTPEKIRAEYGKT